jgi:6-pyruvoyl-tetrahydropterin synthase
MFAVEVREHIMIAHSLPREVFGPAQGMHGATFVVDAAFFTEDIDPDGLAIDIGLATRILSEVLQPLNYANLDAIAEFRGKVTTTEFLAREIHGRIADRIRTGQLGDAGKQVRSLRVTLHESHVARAWYEKDL